MIEILYNPYSGVDWLTAQRVKAVSHEHAYDSAMVARMYDRGIRFFAHLHYQPAVPRCPLSDFGGTFQDWHYYDASNFYKTGDKSTKPTFTAVQARKQTPLVISGVTTNFRSSGLTVAYLDAERNNRCTQLLRDMNEGESWDELCEDETAWVERTWDDVDANLTRNNKSMVGSIQTFTSASSASAYNGGISDIAFSGDGLVHSTDDFPQIPNCEHPQFMALGHFNVLGSFAPEPGWSYGAPTDWRNEHRYYDIDDIGSIFTPASSFYDGKLFGTQNHNDSVPQFKELQDAYSWFKGLEIFNNGMQRTDWESYLNSFHQLLNDGRTVYALAVTDWQGDFRGGSDVDGGTNVLYVPEGYNSLSTANKAKAGMDCYINGKFVASRFGTQHIVDFSVNGGDNTVHLKVSAIAKTLSVVFNGIRTTLENADEMTVNVPQWAKNVTCEAWFGDSNGNVWKSETKLADNADFLFSQAILIRTYGYDQNNLPILEYALS